MLFRRIRFLSVPLLAALLLAGCKPQPPAPTDRVPPNPNAPALYGPPTGTASKEIPRALPHSRDTSWQSAPFYVLHTELSPAILVHSSTRYLGLFSDLAELVLGAPSHVAWSTKDGPRAFKAGETQDSTGMEENWLLVWFAGATNWTNWDSPWAVFLQHKPGWIRLDERGLHLEFPASAGDVVLMPLYGYFKLPPAGRDYLAEHGLKSRRLNSWEWDKALARDPLTRLRFWAGASREFPIYCEDSFSVDRAHDEVTIRSRFEWHSIDDDWRTKHIKLAPIGPELGLAAMDKALPVKFSKPFFDMELPTPFGPYLGIQGVGSFDATFSVLHHVNEMEAFQVPDTNAHPNVARALVKLHELISTNPPMGKESPDDKSGPLQAEFMTTRGVESFAKALPYLDPPMKEKLTGRLKEFFLANTNPPGPPTGSGGNHRLRSATFQALWAYGQFADDWETVRQVWPRRRKEVRFMSQRAWTGFGQALLPQEAEECAALARVAYRMGDMDMYHYASLQVVHELAHAWSAIRGRDYSRKHPPWDSMEWRAEEIAETNRVAPYPVAARPQLLSESPEQLATAATPDPFTDVPHQFLAALRASGPARFTRLIPPGEPSSFVAGLEREVTSPSPSLFTRGEPVAAGEMSSTNAWPQLTWPVWKAPTGAPWSFGRIKPVRDGQPASVRRQALNWNTEVAIYTLP